MSFAPTVKFGEAQHGLALLAKGDLAGWRQHFSQVGETLGAVDAYFVREKLATEALQIKVRNARDRALISLCVAEETLALLADDPHQPDMLHLAAIACFDSGLPRAAEALLKATKKLRPEHTGPDALLRTCKKLRGSRATNFAEFHKSEIGRANDVAALAERVARNAAPRTDLTLGLCMIVKDEEEMLPRCLNSMIEWIDELIIVDTGSSDRTVEIAELFGATVLHTPWTNDFSAARNVGWDVATSDWLMALDADEVLPASSGPLLRRALQRTWMHGFLIDIVSALDADGGSLDSAVVPRISRNMPQYRWQRPMHEQLFTDMDPRQYELLELQVEHHGYSAEVTVQKNKVERNLTMMKAALDVEDSPYDRFQLGMAEYNASDYASAHGSFTIALDMCGTDTEQIHTVWYPRLVSAQLMTLLQLGEIEGAKKFLQDSLSVLPNFAEGHFRLGEWLTSLGRLAEAETAYQAALASAASANHYGMPGSNSYLPELGMARVRRAQGRTDDALKMVDSCLTAKPDFAAAYELLSSVMLDTGASFDDIVSRAEAAAGSLSSPCLFQLSIPFYERRMITEAEDLMRRSLALRPEAERVRVGLVEALLSRSAYGEATQEALRIPSTSPWAHEVAPSLLLAMTLALVHGQETALDWNGALEYARAAGVLDSEVALFQAWHAGGRPEPDSIDASAANLATTVLRALITLGEFDEFGRLAVVFEALSASWRVRRELMARVYLAAGALDFAADEWVAVVQEQGADRQAMQGLALVSEQRGLSEEAEFFRAEAEALVPA